ncbi:DUF5703 domain-containing protein [Paenibacillus lemnae]|uniref:DUF5703 domain-containing protein n=1 Tax=Paenibacillus lemnae TaxID=1330551 RepID=A0A848M595_PAELE|nr:DUF5703 domain-containing protein [Paenibacillus lemnae]NMO94963.1 hypothetical protein [Paenibacillus lemnae]
MDITKYNVRWDSQSRNSGESMPCGGFDTGANVWVENNEVLLYIDRSGSFDENNQMLKMGRFRIRFDDNPFEELFVQELMLQEGRIRIEGKRFELNIWFDTSRPVCHVEMESESRLGITVQYENWRFKERALPPNERMAAASYVAYPGEVITYPDQVAFEEQSLTFYHQNRNDKLLFDFLVNLQHLNGIKDQLMNPQQNLIFGGRLFGDTLKYKERTLGSYAGVDYEGYAYTSVPDEKHHFMIAFHTEQTPSVEEWKSRLEDLSREAEQDISASERSRAWWDAFWNRSFIDIEPYADEQNTGFQLARNYALFRYMLGCNAYGAYPTKFNGGLFIADPAYSVGPEHEGKTPDFRAWGGGSFTAQNQRLVYWPMLKSGDFDMMAPQFEFYRRLLHNAELRTLEYWGHRGCSFTEQVENMGLPIGWNWGFQETEDLQHLRPKNFDRTEMRSAWIRYEYITQVEFAFMIIQYYRYTGNDIGKYIPFIESCVTFFFEHYEQIHRLNAESPYDADGKLVIFPSTALETYKDALNPTDVISGLKAILTELSRLDEYVDSKHYQELYSRVPDYKTEIHDGKERIAPAYAWTHIINCELPQLYPVFPYALEGIGRGSLDRAIHTWRTAPEEQKHHISWHQDGIFTARLGLVEEAVEINSRKLSDSGRRFPAFWGPGHDWVPDHNWGGSGMIGLQDMLVQQKDHVIYVFPAWPKTWNVSFKLHLSGKTIIEASLVDGKADWKVHSEQYADPVVICCL